MRAILAIVAILATLAILAAPAQILPASAKLSIIFDKFSDRS